MDSSHKRKCCLCGEKRPTLHSFPKNDEIRSVWKQICNYQSYDNVSTLRICSDHFKSDDYIDLNAKKCGGNLRLKSDRYPSVNVPNPKAMLRSPNVKVEILESSAEIIENVTSTENISMEVLPPSTSAEILENNTSAVNIDTEVLIIKTEDISDEAPCTPTKRKFHDPRYLGEVVDADLATPRKAMRVLNLAKQQVKRITLKNRALMARNRRLEKKVKILQNVLKHFKCNNHELSEAVPDALTNNVPRKKK